MKWTTYRLQLLSPTFCAGADQRKAEIRVPSIRGQVRWWFRALGGTPSEEKDIFGGVHGAQPVASKISMRLARPVTSAVAKNLQDLGLKMGDPQAYLLWPLRGGREGDGRRGILAAGTQFDLAVGTRFGLPEGLNAKFESALFAWIILGTLGTRSRRGYGSVWPTDDSEFPFYLESLEEVAGALDDLLKPFGQPCLRVITLSPPQPHANAALDQLGKWLKGFRAGSTRSGERPSRWGRNDHDNAVGSGQILYRPVLGLPLTQRYTSDGTVVNTTFDDAGRWASPVHLKVIRCKSEYYPVAIFFPDMAMPDGAEVRLTCKGRPSRTKRVSWSLFKEMMNPPTGGAVLWKPIP